MKILNAGKPKLQEVVRHKVISYTKFVILQPSNLLKKVIKSTGCFSVNVTLIHVIIFWYTFSITIYYYKRYPESINNIHTNSNSFKDTLPLFHVRYGCRITLFFQLLMEKQFGFYYQFGSKDTYTFTQKVTYEILNNAN